MPSEYRDELRSGAEQARHLQNSSLPAPPERHAWRLYSFHHVDVTCPAPTGPAATCAAASAVLTARRSANCTRGRPSVAGDAFWFAYAPTMGQFHHFMMEWLPNVAFLLAAVPAERLAQRATVLITDEWARTSSFVHEALQALAIPTTALQPVPAAGLCVGSRVLYPEKLAYLFGAVSHPAAQILRLLRAASVSSTPTSWNVDASRSPQLSSTPRLSAAASTLPISAAASGAPGELVFIDRLDAPRVSTKRVLTNAAELGAALRSRGFQQLSIAELSFRARAAVLSKARVVVMLAGAIPRLPAPSHAVSRLPASSRCSQAPRR